MAQNHHYIIGDVHGEYPMLLAYHDGKLSAYCLETKEIFEVLNKWIVM